MSNKTFRRFPETLGRFIFNSVLLNGFIVEQNVVWAWVYTNTIDPFLR